MNTLNNFIIEKLKINSNSKVNELRDLSSVDYKNVDKALFFNTYKEELTYQRYIDKFKKKTQTSQYIQDFFIENINSERDLLIYWYLSITNGLIELASFLKQKLIDQWSYSEDELDAYVLSRYQKLNGFNYTQENMKKYFKEYNIKYEESD